MTTTKCGKGQYPVCTLPAGHDGRHWHEGVGFFRLMSSMPGGREYEAACAELACMKCKGKGQLYDCEDEEYMGCWECRGSGLRTPRTDDLCVLDSEVA